MKWSKFNLKFDLTRDIRVIGHGFKSSNNSTLKPHDESFKSWFLK